MIATEVLDEIVERLVAEFRPEQVVLFGSHAWGQPREDSDLDLLVVVRESELSPTQRAVKAHQCLSDIAAPMDILVKTRSEIERYRHVPGSFEHDMMERERVLYG